MTAISSMSPDGQVTIPADVREALGLRAGEPLEWSKVSGGVLLRPALRKSGRSFEDIEGEIRRLVRYDGPPVSIDEMKQTISERWVRSALRSDSARG